MKATIRAYKDSDYEAVKQTLKECNHYNPDLDTKQKLHKKIVADPESILVAEIDGTVIGNVYFIDDSWNPTVWRLAVRSEYRKKGVGETLVKEVEKILKKRGRDEIRLFTGIHKVENIKYYQRLGYTALPTVQQVMQKRL